MPGYDPFATPAGAQHDQVMPNPTPVSSALGAIAAPVQQSLMKQQRDRLSQDAFRQARDSWRAARPDRPAMPGDPAMLADWRGSFRDALTTWRDSRPTHWDAGQWGAPIDPGAQPVPGNFEGQFPTAPGEIGIGQPGWAPAPPTAQPVRQSIAGGNYFSQPRFADWRARLPTGA